MIERWIKNDLNLKRYRLFKRQKRSVISIWFLIVLTFFSLTASFWANSKPIYLFFGGKHFFPVLKDYHPTEFQIENELVMNYKKLELKDSDWAIWPLIKWDPFESNKKVESYPAPPSRVNLLGTDDRGRDILVRLLYGYFYSMTYALTVWVICIVLAFLLGGPMGYFGGWTDLIGQRIVEIISTIPTFLLLLILVSIFKPTLTLLIILTAAFGWMGMSQYVRAEFLKNRKREFAEAARALGGSHRRVIFRHILPNSLVPIITFSPFIIASHVTGLTALDYLGFGLTPPTPSWGELLNQAQKHFTVAWWLAVYPSLALFGTLVLLALVGDGIRAAFDPKKA